MGVFSEMSMEQEYGNNPASVNIVPTVPAEPEVPAWDEPAETVPPAFEEEPHQQTEPETAPDALIQVNGAPDGEQTVPQGSAAAETSDDTADGKEDEDAKRQAHEAAEAQRKADWEAKQQQKKAALQAELDRLAAMSDDEVMLASMKRVSIDTERLTRRNMKDCVSEYIQTKCLEDPAFARRVGHPRKSMIHCIWYINRKAREYIEQEMKDNDIKPENGVYGSDVPDDLCYQWAVDYFNDPDAKEDQEEDEKFVPKPYAGKTAKSAGKGKAKSKTKKDPAPKKAATTKAEPKKSAVSEQITLGGFVMPEEKAG